MWIFHYLYEQLSINEQSCAISNITAMNNFVHIKMCWDWGNKNVPKCNSCLTL